MGIKDDTDRHQIYLSKLASGILNAKIYPSLEEAYKAARALLLDQEEIKTYKQLQALQSKIVKSSTSIIAKGWQQATEEMELAAIYEADYYASLLQAYGAAGLAVPAAARIKSYVNQSIMTLTNGSRVSTGSWAEYVNGAVDSSAKMYNGIVVSGYNNNLTVGQIAKQIKDSTAGVLTNEANALARTGMNHYANQAREAMAIDNDDVIKYRVYSATFDNRTSIQCRAHATNPGHWAINDKKFPPIPNHFNCLLGEAEITSAGSITGVSKRPFKGKIFTVSTASGRKLSMTPNHPVLTDCGWIAAQELNLGQSLVCEPDGDVSVVAFSGDNYGVKPTIENIFESCGRSGKMVSGEVKLSAPDFHGDCSDNEIGVIWSDIELANILNAIAIKKGGEPVLKPRFSSAKSFISCFSHFAGRLKTNFGALYSKSVSYCHSLKSFFWGYFHASKLLLRPVSGVQSSSLKFLGEPATAKSELFGNGFYSNSEAVSLDNVRQHGLKSASGCHFFLLGSTPDFDPRISQNLSDNGKMAIEILGDTENRIPCEIHLDDIVDIAVSDYDGHVYNLQTLSETYTANGIVTHNCRCSYVYVTDLEEISQGKQVAIGGKDVQVDPDRKLKYRGKKDTDIFNPGQISAGTTQDEWMRQQPDWFQDSALGKERAKLFREGVKIENFVDGLGKPINLDRLRELDIEALKKAAK